MSSTSNVLLDCEQEFIYFTGKISKHITSKKDNKVIGLMGLRITELWWCYDQVFMDQFTYVAPEGRKSRAIHKLVKFADGLAKQARMPLIIANFGVKDTERKSLQ